MAGTKFSDYLGLKHYKKGKRIKNLIHLNLANWPQSFSSYHRISPKGNSGYRLKCFENMTPDFSGIYLNRTQIVLKKHFISFSYLDFFEPDYETICVLFR